MGIHGMEPAELARRLKSGSPTLVIDSRSFSQDHIRGAVRLTTAQVDGYVTRGTLSRDTVVVAVCYRGFRSTGVAATVAASRGHERVRSLGGGMQRWREQALPVEIGPAPGLAPGLLRPPVVRVSKLAQVCNTVAAFGLKPLYMLLSLLIIFILLGGKQQMERAKLPFFCAMGLLTFSAMRFFLLQSYHEAPLLVRLLGGAHRAAVGGRSGPGAGTLPPPAGTFAGHAKKDR